MRALRPFRLPFAVVLLLASACRPDEPKAEGKDKQRPPAPVATVRLDEDELWIERKYLGEVWARGEASLSVAEPGRVRKVHVIEGDRVKRGKLLLELDDRLARAELNQAIAQREQVGVQKAQAEREAERFRRLQAQAVTTEAETERETAEADALSAESEGAAATVKVRSEVIQRHRILAPFDGTVARRLVDPGDWLSPGVPALHLVTDNRVEVQVRVPVELLSDLASVESVTIRDGARSLEAQLSGAVNALERSTRTALLRLDPASQPEWLRSGATVDVVFRVLKRGKVVVPRDALVQGVAATRVIRVKGNKADPVAVEVGESQGQLALLVDGKLQKGDHVVVRGNERLRPGQELAPTTFRPEAAPSAIRPAPSASPP